jgi:hypothetical protein
MSAADDVDARMEEAAQEIIRETLRSRPWRKEGVVAGMVAALAGLRRQRQAGAPRPCTWFRIGRNPTDHRPPLL